MKSLFLKSMEKIKLFLFKILLYIKTHSLRVKLILLRYKLKPHPSSPKFWKEKRRKYKVGVIQMELYLISSMREYVNKLVTLTQKAVEEGADLVCFPEDCATHLLGLLPIAKEVSSSKDLGDIKVKDIFAFLTPYVKNVYFTTFKYLAKKLGRYILGGSIVIKEGNDVKNIAYLFSPEGKIIGKQEKNHLFTMEKEWGLSPGKDFQVFDTLLGKIGILVCMDATYWESAYIAKKLGAEILFVPSANPEKYNFYEQIRGLWGRVQETKLFGIQACMVGKLLDYVIEGRSSIYAPLEITENFDGIWKSAKTWDKEEILISEIDLDLIQSLSS